MSSKTKLKETSYKLKEVVKPPNLRCFGTNMLENSILKWKSRFFFIKEYAEMVRPFK